MSIELKVLLSTLKMTKEKPSTTIEALRLHSRIPSQNLREMIDSLAREGTLTVSGDLVNITPTQRIEVAVRAISIGADPERVCSLLRWDEFEDVSVLAFEAAGFSVKKHFRFKWSGRRWEIDVLGRRGGIVASVDCKHWRRNWHRSSIVRIVKSHVDRTRALAEASRLVGIGINREERITFIPIILSLIPGPFKFYMRVPIVPILQLQDFLYELEAHIDALTHFTSICR